MRMFYLLIFVLTFSLYLAPAQAKEEPDQKGRARIEKAYGKIPLAFIENRGQVAEPVKYLLRGPRGTVFFTPEEVVFELIEKKPKTEEKTGALKEEKKPPSSPESAVPDKPPAEEKITPSSKEEKKFPLSREPTTPEQAKSAMGFPGERSEETPAYQGVVVRMKFVNANPQVKVEGKEELPGRVNILKGKDPQGWKTNIRRFRKITYLNLYPGLNLTYSGEGNNLSWNLGVDSPEKVKTFQVRYQGIESLALEDSGNLRIKTALGTISEKPPALTLRKKETSIPARFILLDKNTVGIDVRPKGQSPVKQKTEGK